MENYEPRHEINPRAKTVRHGADEGRTAITLVLHPYTNEPLRVAVEHHPSPSLSSRKRRCGDENTALCWKELSIKPHGRCDTIAFHWTPLSFSRVWVSHNHRRATRVHSIDAKLMFAQNNKDQSPYYVPTTSWLKSATEGSPGVISALDIVFPDVELLLVVERSMCPMSCSKLAVMSGALDLASSASVAHWRACSRWVCTTISHAGRLVRGDKCPRVTQ